MAAPVPVFTPNDITHITNQEWETYRNNVDAFHTQVQNDITTLDATAVLEPTPAVFTANPTNATGRLNAAMQASLWLYRLQAQHNGLQVAAAVANAAAGQPAAPPPAAGGVNMNLLLQMMAQMQQQQAHAQAGPPPRVKTALPAKYDRSTTLARRFLSECENYFILNPMAADQQVRFALQLLEGEAGQWKETQLDTLQLVPLPPWANNWRLFKDEFNERFEDREAQSRARHLLLTGKIVQTTTVRKFIEQVRDVCQKAGWNNEDTWMTLIREGLKDEVASIMYGRYPDVWRDFVRDIERADEDLQRHKAKKKPVFKKTTPVSSSDKLGKRPDNSKYSLTEEERKEHFEKKLCFKCHKPNCSSKTCKNPRTVYSEVKKSNTQVANIETKDDSKGKGKEIAKIDEVSDTEKEDFVQGD